VRLLILTQYYPPEVGAAQNRLSDLARRLATRGHDVHVLTALPNYPGATVFPAYQGRAGMSEILDHVTVHRAGLYVPSRPTLLRRMRCYLSFAVHAAMLGRRILPRADLLMMESPPLFLAPAGIYLARRLGARLVVNVSDLWPRSVLALGLVKPGLATRLAEALERWMISSADLVTGQTTGIVEDIARRFRHPAVRLFPNGADVELYQGELQRDAVRAEFGWPSDLFVVGYAGLLGHAQALSQVLHAAQRLHQTPAVHVALFGHGPCLETLKREAEALRLTNLRFYSPQPSARMPHVQAAFDAGLVPLAKDDLFRGARPSKMFEIMAAGRPVVLAGEGESTRIVLGATGGPAGIAVPPESPDNLAGAIAGLARDRAEAAAMGRRGRAHVFEHFDRARIAGEIEVLFEALLAGDVVARAAAPVPERGRA
jgi:glycosyltransferase involved in cell wall biosynthesis